MLRLGQEDEAEGQQQAQAVLSAFAPDVLVLLAGEATALCLAIQGRRMADGCWIGCVVAMSSPAGCERDPDRAMAVNAPRPLLQALADRAAHQLGETLVVFLSTVGRE